MYQTTYHRPSSVDEAAALFAKGAESKYLAGGHTLIPVMKQRLASPSDVIDLGKIKDLIGIEVSADTVTNGWTACSRETRRYPRIPSYTPYTYTTQKPIPLAMLYGRSRSAARVASWPPGPSWQVSPPPACPSVWLHHARRYA